MKGIVEEQHLFNLYVHLPPNKTLEGPPTIFNGHEIPGSIQTGDSPSDVSPGQRIGLLADPSSNPKPLMDTAPCAERQNLLLYQWSLALSFQVAAQVFK